MDILVTRCKRRKVEQERVITTLPHDIIRDITYYLVTNDHAFVNFASTCRLLLDVVWSGVDHLEGTTTLTPVFSDPSEWRPIEFNKNVASCEWKDFCAISTRPLHRLRSIQINVPQSCLAMYPTIKNLQALTKVTVTANKDGQALAWDKMGSFLVSLPSLETLKSPADLLPHVTTLNSLRKLVITESSSNSSLVIRAPTWLKLDKLKYTGTARNFAIEVRELVNLTYLDMAVVAATSPHGFWAIADLAELVSWFPRLSLLRIPSPSADLTHDIKWEQFIKELVEATHDATLSPAFLRLLTNCGFANVYGSLFGAPLHFQGVGATEEAKELMMRVATTPYFDVGPLMGTKCSKSISRHSLIHSLSEGCRLYTIAPIITQVLLNHEDDVRSIFSRKDYDHEDFCYLLAENFFEFAETFVNRFGFDPSYNPSRNIVPMIFVLAPTILQPSLEPIVHLLRNYLKVDFSDTTDINACAIYCIGGTDYGYSALREFILTDTTGLIPPPSLDFMVSAMVYLATGIEGECCEASLDDLFHKLWSFLHEFAGAVSLPTSSEITEYDDQKSNSSSTDGPATQDECAVLVARRLREHCLAAKERKSTQKLFNVQDALRWCDSILDNGEYNSDAM